MENKFEEALPMLEAAIGEDPTEEKAYIYISIMHEASGQYEDAIAILQEGLPYAKKLLPNFHFNLGNNFFALKKYDEAEKQYSQAIQTKSGFAAAYLNRANTRVQNTAYREAINDYNLYLKIKPQTQQRQNIEKVIDILTKRLAEAERIKREEEKQRREEEARKAEEEKKRAEEERKRKEEEERKREEEKKRQEALLQEVLESLNNAEEDTTDLEAGSEDIEEFDLDIELEP